MAYKCSFLDNETYSAQDVNDIFARITSGGVIFSDTGYTLGDLNTVQSNIADGGVVRDTNSCKVLKDGNKYKISKGACFMNDGSAIIFDDDGYEIEITDDVLNYVYLKRNVVANTIDVVVSESAGDADSIPLAEINYRGEISDRRKYARAKVDLAVSDKIRNFTVYIPACTSSSSETIPVDMGDNDYSYAIMWDGKMVYSGEETGRVSCGKNLATLIEDDVVATPIGVDESTQNEKVYFMKKGQMLHVFVTGAFRGAEYVLNVGVI